MSHHNYYLGMYNLYRYTKSNGNVFFHSTKTFSFCLRRNVVILVKCMPHLTMLKYRRTFGFAIVIYSTEI